MSDKKTKTQQINIELDEKVSSGEYSNFVVVTHSPAEFVMDFTRLLPGVPAVGRHIFGRTGGAGSRIRKRRGIAPAPFPVLSCRRKSGLQRGLQFFDEIGLFPREKIALRLAPEMAISSRRLIDRLVKA